MKRISLILFTIFAITPILQVQQAYAMNPWRPKKEDSLGRSAVLPWIRALKMPISVIGAASCALLGGLVTANLLGATVPGNGELPVPVSSIFYGLGLGYVASTVFSAVAHKETPYQQTQDLVERTTDTVQDATVKPLRKAVVIPAGAVVVGIPLAVLIGLCAGKDVLFENVTEKLSKTMQILIAVFGFAGAIEYLRQLTDFASNKPQ